MTPSRPSAPDHLVFEQLQHPQDAGFAVGGERPALQAADADEIGAHGDRLDDVGAAAERAVDHDLGAAGDGVDDLGQHLHRAAAVIELAAAVVRHVDPVDAVIDRDRCVFGGRDALDDQRDLVLVLDQLHGAPLQPLLEVAAGGAQPAFADVALGDVAFAPAVMRGVDGQAERGVAVRDRAADAVLDKGVVAADIELIHAQRVGRGLGDLLQAGLGHRAQHMGGAERARAARDAGGGAGIEDLERADRRHHHRQTQFAAEQLDRGVDLGDVAQHPRPECDLVQRHAVAAHGGLGLGGADDVVPGILVEVGARLADEFVQVLEFLGAGAEFDVAAGRMRVASFMVSSRECLSAWRSMVLTFRLSLPELPRHPENCYGCQQRDGSRMIPVDRRGGLSWPK